MPSIGGMMVRWLSFQKSGLVCYTVAYCMNTGCGAVVVAGIACSWMGRKLAGIS